MKNKLITIMSIIILSISPVYAKEKVTLSKCVDGDTFRVIISDKEYIVRMLAIDTPESVKANTPVEYYGKESSNYTCNKLTESKKIELEYDENSDKVDKYNRLLAWVFLDDELLQADLVKNGYAKVAYLYDDYKYSNELKKLQEVASAKELGVWNEEAKQNYQSQEETPEEETTDNQDSIENIVVAIISAILLALVSIFKSIKKNK